jgi:N-acylneuraminate cytidylyltransferase
MNGASISPVTALVPMKAHSERVPGKNTRELCGEPLFHWILRALTRARHITDIVVNTDSTEIAKAVQNRFDVQIHPRPEHLLGDAIVANQLIEHDLGQLTSCDYFLQTHSTNPLLRSESIDRALEAFFAQDVHDALFSVTPLQTRLYWADGSPANHDPDELIQTQALPPIYEENSCLYIFSRAGFQKNSNRLGSNPMMFPLDRYEAIDIDEEFDFTFAEWLMSLRLRSGRPTKSS